MAFCDLFFEIKIIHSCCFFLLVLNITHDSFCYLSLILVCILGRGSFNISFVRALRYKAAVKADPLCYEVCNMNSHFFVVNTFLVLMFLLV